jgi:hypothetical protein
MSLGRPPALDDPKRREICALLNAGLEFGEAARYVGCTPRTIRNEIRRNPVFRREVHDALLSARLAPEKLLRQAAGKNWRAAAWLLERTNPGAYARRPPSACAPEDLDAICRWLIDAALHAVEAPRRNDAFDRLATIVDDAKAQLARRSNPRQPLQTPRPEFYDLAAAMRELKASPFGDGLFSADDDFSAEKSRANCFHAEHSGVSANAGSAVDVGGNNSRLFSAQALSQRAPESASRLAAEPAPPTPRTA